jgi:hypothetical protein
MRHYEEVSPPISRMLILGYLIFASLIQKLNCLRHPTNHRSLHLYSNLLAKSPKSDSNEDDLKFWGDKEKYILSGEVALKEKFIEIDNKRSKELAEKEREEEADRVARLNYREPVIKVPINDVENSPKKSTTSNEKSVPSSNKKVLPFLDISSIGVQGRWLEKSGNFILFPTDENGVELKQPAGSSHNLQILVRITECCWFHNSCNAL